jgi:hypothetical protein
MKFSSYIHKFRGIGCKSSMTNGLLKYGEKKCAFPNKLGSPSLYMICTRSLLNFLIYEENLVFFFISVETNICLREIVRIGLNLNHPLSNYFYEPVSFKKYLHFCKRIVHSILVGRRRKNVSKRKYSYISLYICRLIVISFFEIQNTTFCQEQVPILFERM